MGVLFEPLDEIFGNRAKVRLLRALFAGEGELGLREVARQAQISHVAALRPLDDLALIGVVHRKIFGRQHSYRLNHDSYLYSSLKLLFDQERLRLKTLFGALKQILKQHRAVLGAYLIGSGVRGEDKPGSDLDVLLVVRDARSADSQSEAIASESVLIHQKFGLAISPIVISRNKLTKMLGEGDAFAENSLRDARTIVGPPLSELLNGA